MQTIFLVEDDENIRELTAYALRAAEFTVEAFEQGAALWPALQSHLPDLLLLDIMLPGENGLAMLNKLRLKPETAALPVILLTAKGSEYDKVKGLDFGADDYITKPFSVLELIARVKTVLRRIPQATSTAVLSHESVSLDVEKHIVWVGGRQVPLTVKEFQLLEYLLKNKGVVLTRDKIMNFIWGFEYACETRTVDMHIKTLRQKLGEAGQGIRTVRGIGYVMGGS